MNNMVLVILFSPDMNKVLMCFHAKQEMWNYIGGHIEAGESGMSACYREMLEETGIQRSMVDLKFVRDENVTAACYDPYRLYIATGVLKGSAELKPEKNELKWIDINNVELFGNDSFGMGNCLLFLREAMCVLNRKDLLEQTAVYAFQ